MQQHMELMQSSKQQQQQAGMRLSSDAASVSPADAHLFQTPSDLVSAGRRSHWLLLLPSNYLRVDAACTPTEQCS